MTTDVTGVAEPGVPSRAGRANRWVLAAVGLVAIGALVFWLRGRRATGAAPLPGPEARVVPVLVATVSQRDMPIYLEGLGSVLPLATVTLKCQVDGRLDQVFFKEGQQVKKGELLAQIDPRPFVIQLHTAEAKLLQDTAQLRNAKLNLDRYKSLRASNLISEQQLTDQQTVADQAEGTVEADQAQIDNAKLQLDFARIVSPIDGVTGVRLVDPGNIVHAADTGGIVMLTQLDPIALLFTLPEDDLPRVSKAQAAGSLPVEAYSRDGQTKLGAGKLALIDNEINQTTATMRLKAVFPNPDRALWPNQFVKARLLLETRSGALVVPAAVVQRGPQGTFAYVVAPDNTVSARPLDVDSTQGDWAIIARGLKAGEQVVADGQNQLRPGAKVTPRPQASP